MFGLRRGCDCPWRWGMRPRGVLKAFDGRGEVFLALLTGGSVLFRHDASGFLAPARLTAFENLRQPAAEHLAAPTNSASGDFCQRLDGSILLSSTGLASSGAASSLFFCVAPRGRRELVLRKQDPRGGPLGSSVTGLRALGMPCAITLALMASVLVMPGNLPWAFFSAYHGRWSLGSRAHERTQGSARRCCTSG